MPLSAGIAAVVPAGFTTNLMRDGQPCSLLVTEAVEPAYPLDQFWRQLQADDNPVRRCDDTARVSELLAELIARAHQAGFEHLDMHAANILIQPLAPRRYRALFVDLQSARRGIPISDRAVVRNLAQLNQWFRRHSSLSTRLRFLRCYFRWRNEYEQAYDYARPLGLSYSALVQALARVARIHAERLGAQRDRRTCRDGRYFTHLRLGGGWRGLAVMQTKHSTPESRVSQMTFERDWWRHELANPLHWFQEEGGENCKDSHSASVRRALLAHETGPLPVIVKRPLARNLSRRISQLFPLSRSRRGWHVGHALLHRHVPAARPVAVLERRFGPFVLDNILITEAIPGAMDLERYLRQTYPTCSSSEWWRHKQELCAQVVLHLRRLEEHAFIHRDCKASNILVISQPQLKLLWIDMDGLRRTRRRRVSRRQRLRTLVCLCVSLLDVPGLNRTDQLRLLKSYAARFGADPRAWRFLWRELATTVETKLRTKQARREWKRERYGRE